MLQVRATVEAMQQLASNQPPFMRAVHVPASGEQATLAEVPTPTQGAGEILLRVRAAGLNPFDNHIAAGWLEPMLEHRYPLVLGRDASGVVEAVGEGVTGLTVGEEVIAHVPFGPMEVGTLAEYVVLPANSVAAKPVGLDHISAAALPLAAGAALTLIEAVDVRAGQVVLVNGASGGVGRFVVQLLAQRGITVVATASPDSTARMQELGASDVIDYTAGPVAQQVKELHPDGVDALINLVGYTLEDVPLDALRPGGAVRTVTQVPDDATIADRGLTGGGVIASPDRSVIAPLAAQAADGTLQVDVARVTSLADALAGLDDIAAHRAHGKIVVDLDARSHA